MNTDNITMWTTQDEQERARMRAQAYSPMCVRVGPLEWKFTLRQNHAKLWGNTVIHGDTPKQIVVAGSR